MIGRTTYIGGGGRVSLDRVVVLRSPVPVSTRRGEPDDCTVVIYRGTMSTAPARDDHEDDCDLGWAIGMLMRHYRSRVQPTLADLPRGARAFQLLYTVINKDLPNQLQMAEYLGIDRTVMPYVIDDLVEAGLVRRTPDPTDRRARKVTATELGVSTFRELQNQVSAAESVVLSALNAREQAVFRTLLSRLARRARDVDSAVVADEDL